MRARSTIIAAALTLAGCAGGSATEARLADDGAVRPSTPTSGTCPLTLPNGRTPPGPTEVGANHGNGALWTALWPHNVVIATPPYIARDGSVWMKWPWWWRRTTGRELVVTGRRLDGSAPPLTAYVPHGYKRGFRPTGLSFPTPGCWEVTGRVGTSKLTFVTLVLKASRYWPADG